MVEVLATVGGLVLSVVIGFGLVVYMRRNPLNRD
ncbi:high-affinity Fe2+/Pb2+ permease [Marmoricola sp. OAE513]